MWLVLVHSRFMILFGVLLFALIPVFPVSEASHGSHAGYYIGGGWAGVTFGLCPKLNIGGERHDLGGVCALKCSFGHCEISIDDMVRGDNVRFRVCIKDPGPHRCPAELIADGSIVVEANIVDVAVDAREGTRGKIMSVHWDG